MTPIIVHSSLADVVMTNESCNLWTPVRLLNLSKAGYPSRSRGPSQNPVYPWIDSPGHDLQIFSKCPPLVIESNNRKGRTLTHRQYPYIIGRLPACSGKGSSQGVPGGGNGGTSLALAGQSFPRHEHITPHTTIWRAH